MAPPKPSGLHRVAKYLPEPPPRTIRFGRNPIYLPKFTITLIPTPDRSPYEARFQVPLYFSKLDLRDYLFNAYNVRALSIRSVVHQQPVRDHRDGPRQFFRPESKKFMTIEMTHPFVWPKEPESWEPWGKSEKGARDRSGANEESQGDAVADKREGQTLRQQAEDLLRLSREKKLKGKNVSADKNVPDEEQQSSNNPKRVKAARTSGAKRALRKWEDDRLQNQLELDEKTGYKIRV